MRTFPKQLPSVTPFEQLLLITTLIPLATAGFTRKSRRRPLITSRGNFFRHTFTLKRGMDEDGLRKRYLLPGHKKGKEGRGENLGGLILYYVYFSRNSIIAQTAVNGFPRNTPSLAEFHYYVFSLRFFCRCGVRKCFFPVLQPLGFAQIFRQEEKEETPRLTRG